MSIEFTKEQQAVIDCRKCNLLVSAAAGSGKTAVLVERIITRLTKDTPPLNVDELLIVTFTEAAAAEMKERIHDAIEKMLDQDPYNEHLCRQAALVHNAQITTIHSFCLSVIRDHFHVIDLEPGFRVAEEGEVKLLKYDALADVLETFYAEGREDFLDFVECFTAGRKDDELEGMILRIFEFSSGYPDPEEWLEFCLEQYRNQEHCFTNIADYIRQYTKDFIIKTKYMISICEEEDGPKAYLDALHSDLQFLEKLSQAENYVEMFGLFCNLKWKSLAANRDKSVSENLTKRVQKMRNEMKEQIKKLTESYFFRPLEELEEDMKNALKNMSVLVELVKCFRTAFQEKKNARNVIDFSDMEHYALEILKKEAVAEEYRNQFAEIMIDEYQDSNLIQEALLTAVSRMNRGENNIFMVGDVKQSIYSFRLSRPDLFMKKYATYEKGLGENRRIDLHKNFRSRKEVLESSNFIFRQIMQGNLGGIDYTDDAALYLGAKYEPGEDNETELLLISQEDLPDKNKQEWEARLVAGRIKELVGHHMVTDKKTGKMRPAEYGDIVVLTRSLKGWTDVYARVLSREGIPTHTDSRSGYYETLEIQLLLDYLKVLDNPYQDIPLAAVLTSVFGKMTNEELAKIKAGSHGKNFFNCICSYAENGTEAEIQKKLHDFLAQLESFRDQLCYLPIQDLVRNVLRETGYMDFVSAMPGGTQRQANLEMLLEKAVAFEKTSYKGLFHFVRYIEQLKKYDVDCGEANTEDEYSQAVRLMSIHKSKGLEFPIVFVGGMGKKFNMQDTTSPVAVHAELGIGIHAIDYKKRTKNPTLLRKIIQREISLDTLAEEMRILYVAMTRAKEKLILVGVEKNLQEKLDTYGVLRNLDEEPLFYSQLIEAKTFLDWVLPALYRNQAMDEMLNHFCFPSCFTNALYKQQSFTRVCCVLPEQIVGAEIREEVADKIEMTKILNMDEYAVYDEQLQRELMEQMEYQYPYDLSGQYHQKMSVSELKKRSLEETEEEIPTLFPKYIQGEEKATGAFRGSAYHRFLELIDYGKPLAEQLESMVNSGYLTEEMAQTIYLNDIERFLDSSVGMRMKKAGEDGKLYREKPFMLGLPAGEIYPEAEEKEEFILVQGIIDAYFQEEEGIVIVDYKTDYATTPEELVQKYQGQLDYYGRALEQLTGVTVKQRIIYSFCLGREIEV